MASRTSVGLEATSGVASASPDSSRIRPLLHTSYDRALWAPRTWLDSWSGIGHVAVRMHRQASTCS